MNRNETIVSFTNPKTGHTFLVLQLDFIANLTLQVPTPHSNNLSATPQND